MILLLTPFVFQRTAGFIRFSAMCVPTSVFSPPLLASVRLLRPIKVVGCSSYYSYHGV